MFYTLRKRFADMMLYITREPGLGPEHLVRGYPWAELGEATVVDLGGSHGVMACSLAREYPSLKLIVQVRIYISSQKESKGGLGKLTYTTQTYSGPR